MLGDKRLDMRLATWCRVVQVRGGWGNFSIQTPGGREPTSYLVSHNETHQNPIVQIVHTQSFTVIYEIMEQACFML